VEPQMTAQMDHVLRSKPNPPTMLPEQSLCWWLRQLLLQSPAHWYAVKGGGGDLETGEAANGDGTRAGSNTAMWIEMDFSTVIEAVEHESTDCKYNIRDVRLTDDGVLTVNAINSGGSTSVEKFTATETPKTEEDDENRKRLRHAVFLTMSITQAANECCYHNWIHFYYNDIVLFTIKSLYDEGHWVRRLMDPHMRYQTVLNNAGMFSNVPSEQLNDTVWDDMLYGARLSSWSFSTFNTNIIDKVLGYYVKANVSEASRETLGLEFNLNRMPCTASPEMDKLCAQAHKEIWSFVGEVVDLSLTPETAEREQRVMALFSDCILKHLHKGCLDGLAEDQRTPKELFRLIITRYILMAGFLHGLEHFQAYFWTAPLNIPQRIRKVYDTRLELEEYSYDIDKQNGRFGHLLFTRYWPNADNEWNWESLAYDFEKGSRAKDRSSEFVGRMQGLVAEYDQTVLLPARQVLSKHDIPFPEFCVLTPARIGCSICM